MASIVPDAIRGDTTREWKPFFAYLGVTNMFTPAQLARLEASTRDGGPLFRKAVIPRDVLDGRAQEVWQGWQDDPNALIRFLTGWQRGDHGATTAQAEALRAMASASFEQAYAQKEAGLMSAEDFDAFEGRYVAQDNTLAYATAVGSEAARTLQARRTPTRADLYLDLKQRLKDAEGTVPAADLARLKDDIEAAMRTNDFYRLQRLGPQLTNPTLRQMWKEAYIGSLVSAPATWATNVFSTNAHMVFQQAAIAPIRGALDGAFSYFTGRAQQNFVSSGLPALGTFFKGMPRQFQQFWWLWTGDTRAQALPVWQRSGAFGGAELGNAEGALRRATWRGEPATYVRKLAPFLTFASSAMEAMDVAMRGLAVDMQLANMARDRSHRMGLGTPQYPWQLSTLERDWIAAQLADPVTGDTSDLLKQIVKPAADQSIFRDKTSRFAGTIQQLSQVPGAGVFVDILLPFRSTPDRLLARGLELLPGNPFILGSWAKRAWETRQWSGWMPRLSSEVLTPEDATMFAKQAVGALMAGALYALYASGNVTGNAPDDPKEREAFYRQGKVPQAVRVGDTWLSYRRFEPMSLPLGILTTVFAAKDRLEARRVRTGMPSSGYVYDHLALATVAAQAAIEHVLDSSYFSGLAAFFAGTQRGREAGDIPKGVMRQVGSLVTPLVGMQRALIRAADSAGLTPGAVPGTTLVRQPAGLGETIAGMNLPAVLAGGGGPPRLDIFGKPETRQTTPYGELIPGVPPVQRGTAVDSDLERTLQRLQYFPGHMKPTDHLGLKIPEALYRRMDARRGELMQPLMEALVARDSFPRLTPTQQKTALERIVTTASDRARREVLGRRAA